MVAAGAIRVKLVPCTLFSPSFGGADRVSPGRGGSCAWHGGSRGGVGLGVRVLGIGSGRGGAVTGCAPLGSDH